MKRYIVTAEVTISMHTIVEAESDEEARSIAEGRSNKHLCHQCAGDDNASEEWCTSGELDGSPERLRVEEAE